MKAEDVPQDLKYLKDSVCRDVAYAVDDDGKYQMVMSDGWEVKNGELIPVMTKVKTNNGDNVKNPAFAGTIVTATEPTYITPGLAPGTEGDGSVTFVGTYDPVTIGPDGDNTKLYFSTANTLYWPNGAMTINPFRAYLQLNTAVANIRAYQINFGEDETTGIISLTPDPSPKGEGRLDGEGSFDGEGSDGWYTIDGRKLGSKPTQHGIYINGGRKVVIK